MIPIKGLYKDTILRKQPEGFSPDVRNMVIDKISGTYANEPGNTIVSTIATDRNLIINGIKDIGYGNKIIMSINGDLSEIGILDKDYNYTVKLLEDLGFDVNYPFADSSIQIEYNYKGELIIAFTDNLNTPKIVNLDNLPTPFTPTKTELFPSFKTPQVDSEIIDSSGGLQTGAYFPAFKYRNNDGTETAYTVLNNPIFIVPSETTVFDDYEGGAGGTITSKAIQLTLTNVDTSFDKIVLGVLIKQNGVITAKEIKDTPTGNTVTILYTGTETPTDITSSEIIVSPAYYNRIKHFTQVQGTLYGADTGEDFPINLQKYASLIKLKFKSELLNVKNLPTSYKVNDQNNKKRGYLHEEVYAFYLIGKLKKGGWTKAFTIPGRVATAIQGIYTGQEDALNSTLISQSSTFTTDVGIDANSKYYQTRDTTRDYDTGTGIGTFGLWINENETYPNTVDFDATSVGGEDLRNQPVRHFRFPSIKKCKSVLYSSETEYGKTKLDALSLVIDEFPTIPSEILDLIEGFEIGYAKRTVGNSTVVAQDIVLMGATKAGDGTQNQNLTAYSAGGNWTNQTQGSSTDSGDLKVYNKYLRFHAFDLLLNRPAVSPSYISNQLFLSRGNIGHGHAWLSGPDVWGFDIDYTQPDATATILANEDEKLISIKSFQYVPNNVQSGKIYNYRSEACAFAEIVSGNNRLRTNEINFMEVDSVRASDIGLADTYLTNLMNYRKDMYNSFYGQTLVLTGNYFLPDAIPSSVYGGDVFISMYSFNTFAQRNLSDFETGQPNFKSLKTVYAFLCESPNNIGFRYEEIGNEGSRYYPKEKYAGTSTWLYNFDTTTDPNRIAYDKSFSSVNEVNPFTTFNPFEIFVSQHPYRIIRSQQPSTEEKYLSWQTFLANDYYELRKDKGQITNIQGINDNLLINTEFTIFTTRANSILKTSTDVEVYVGSGDIFARPPIEMQTDEKGIGGCQNKFSCLLTPAGYFFVDAQKHKPYLVTEKLEELTDGMYNEFISKIITTHDNPFLDTGLTIGWDDEYKRLILSQLDEVPFTYSYSPLRKSWTSEHDAIPSYFFNDRNAFYSLKGQILYKHNTNNYGEFYGTVYPSYVVDVFRLLPQKRDPYEPRDPRYTSEQALFKSIMWRTDVIGENGQILKDKTIDRILIWNSYQSTNEISIVTFNSSLSVEDNFDLANARRIKNKWTFNKFRDAVIDSSLPFVINSNSITGNIDINQEVQFHKRMIDDFLAVKFLFANQKIGSFSPKFYLSDLDITIQPITR